MKLKKRGQATNLDLVLPVEIWHECFTYLPIADYKALSLTCRLLNDICLPFIFKSIIYTCHISFSKGNASEVLKGQLDNLQKNIEALKKFSKSSRHALLITKLVLSQCLHITAGVDKKAAEKGTKSYIHFIETLVECLPRFVNLKEVEVKGSSAKMDKILNLNARAGYPSLEAISMRGINFGVHILKPPIRLLRLSIDNRYGRDDTHNNSAKLLELFSGERLKSLQVWTAAYSPKLFRALTKQGTLERLKNLSFCIKHVHLPDLYAFLSSCPNVECIKIGFSEDDKDEAFSPLPESAVPLLKSFSGPDIAARIFVPGRPVRKVGIKFRYFESKERLLTEPGLLFFPFSQSTEPITELYIESVQCTKVVLNQIVKYFPSLEVLDLAMEVKEIVGGDWEDMSELGTDEDGIMEDNREYASVCANAYEDPIGGGYNSKRTSHFFYIHVHTDYMKLLQSLAHKKTKLPPTIELLFLHRNLFCNFVLRGVPENDKKEAEYVKKYGKPYTATMAQDVFRTLSESYPALRSVIIYKGYKGGLKWVREDDGRWTYGTTFSLIDFHAEATELFQSFDDSVYFCLTQSP